MNPKAHFLFIVCSVGHSCPAIGQILTDPFPKGIPYTAADLINIDISIGLVQPFGQIFSDVERAVIHSDYDDASSPASLSK